MDLGADPTDKSMRPAIPRTSIPKTVRRMCEILAAADFRGWIVGGCVRDLLLGKSVNDWDLATSAPPPEVQRLFRRTIPTGIEHGTVTVLLHGQSFEVTTLRGEGDYSDGRRPDEVAFVSDIEEDLARRDFTVNAIAYDPLSDDLIDPWGGRADLARGIIRAVRDPRERFAEDGLRVLRAARFCGTLGFALEPQTEAAIPESLSTFRRVSPERVQDEWEKAFRKSERPSISFDLMRRTGILSVTCGPLSELSSELWDQTLARLDRTPAEPTLRLAALLRNVAEERDWLDRWLKGMRYSNQARQRVGHLLAQGELPRADELDPPALRRWLCSVGRDALQDVLTLARAEGLDPDQLAERARGELAAGLPLSVRELPVNGADVMSASAAPPGPIIGQVLAALLDDIYEDRSLLDRELLLDRIPTTYARLSAGAD